MSYLLIVNFKAHFFCQTIYLSKTLHLKIVSHTIRCSLHMTNLVEILKLGCSGDYLRCFVKFQFCHEILVIIPLSAAKVGSYLT